MSLTLEAVPAKAVSAEAVAAPEQVEPKRAQVGIGGQINDIAQLPSIWTLEANIEWLIDGVIPIGSVNLITSESGVGKTWLAYAIAGAVARGESFADLKVQQRPVLYLDGENPLCVVKQRLFDLGIPETPDLRVWGGWLGDPPPGPDSPLLEKYAYHHQPLLIWDSLVNFHNGEEQSATDTRKFMNYFRALAHFGATIIVLHHTGKTATSQEYRGTSDIKAAVDMAYQESEFSLNEGIHLLTLRNFKGRFAPGKSFGLKFVKRTGFVAHELPTQPTARDTMQTVIEIAKAHPRSNQSQIVKLAQQTGISKHQVEKCLADGPFNCERGTGRALLYTVPKIEFP
jgi:archaellum biogenesis ATPase FlaH